MQDVKRIEREKKYWDKLSSGYDQMIEKNWTIYRSSLLDKIFNDVNVGDTVLEVACGTGLVGLRVAERASKVIGIDISAPMIDEAEKKRGERSIDNVEFFVEDAYSLHFGDDIFNTAICNNALHNMKYPKKALVEMKRVLKPDGRLIAVIVGFGESSKFNVLYAILKLFVRFPVFHKFNLDKMADMIRDSGFSIVNKEILKNPQDKMPLLYVLAELKA